MTPEERQQKAVWTFANGYNCAQSVFAVLAPDLGLDKDTAMKMASPFGSGIAYMQDTCGAVTGALMALGLKYGKGENGTTKDKERAYELSKQFIEAFRRTTGGSVCCRQLMDGLDMSTSEGMEEIRKRDLFRQRCSKQVANSVSIAEKIISQNK
jgi:C_GCAxxG_C_C family probable redox protein